MPSIQSLAVAAFACCVIAALVGSTPIPIEGSGEQLDGSGEGAVVVDGSGQLPEGSGEEFLGVSNSIKASNDDLVRQESSGEGSGLEGSGFELDAIPGVEASGEHTIEASGEGSGEKAFV
ncbi:hypothetical protein QR680_002237 [Steinernema hermaphroditum]|uniref:Secreted protein n=1 Tax=Steinernema hermaphroditum TaxID=289476 RepID=A0AA39H422_9BILA|nr:hypothetical protein QR680_002237 [Steinernema hermaphroditum]